VARALGNVILAVQRKLHDEESPDTILIYAKRSEWHTVLPLRGMRCRSNLSAAQDCKPRQVGARNHKR